MPPLDIEVAFLSLPDVTTARCLSCLAHLHRVALPLYRRYRKPNEYPTSAGDEYRTQLERYLTLPRLMLATVHCGHCQEELNVTNPPTVIGGANTTPDQGIAVICRSHIQRGPQT